MPIGGTLHAEASLSPLALSVKSVSLPLRPRFVTAVAVVSDKMPAVLT